MTESSSPKSASSPKSDRIGGDYREGPNPAPGGDIDTGDSLVPPYDGRTNAQTANPETRAAVDRIMANTDPGRTGATASPAVERPARDDELTDEEPETPLGVGESVGRRGEKAPRRDGKEPGRSDLPREEAGRPAGSSDERDISGV
jgi:hypothetical protein